MKRIALNTMPVAEYEESQASGRLGLDAAGGQGPAASSSLRLIPTPEEVKVAAENKLVEDAATGSANRRLLQRYMRHLNRGKERSHWTKKSYFIAVRRFLEFTTAVEGKEPLLADVHKNQVLLWQDRMAAAGLAPDTIRSRFLAMRVLFAWMVRDDTSEEYKNPLTGLPVPPASDSRKDIVTPEQFGIVVSMLTKIWKTKGPITVGCRRLQALRDLAILSLFYDTGCRVQEVAQLKPSHVEWDKGLIWVGGDNHGNATKNGEGRFSAPPSPTTLDLIERYMTELEKAGQTPTDAIFYGLNGPLTRTGLMQIPVKRFREAGVVFPGPNRISPHDFRHSAATHFAQARAPRAIVEKAMGWKSSRMFDNYTKSVDQEEAVQSLRGYSPVEAAERANPRRRR